MGNVAEETLLPGDEALQPAGHALHRGAEAAQPKALPMAEDDDIVE